MALCIESSPAVLEILGSIPDLVTSVFMLYVGGPGQAPSESVVRNWDKCTMLSLITYTQAPLLAWRPFITTDTGSTDGEARALYPGVSWGGGGGAEQYPAALGTLIISRLSQALSFVPDLCLSYRSKTLDFLLHELYSYGPKLHSSRQIKRAL